MDISFNAQPDLWVKEIRVAIQYKGEELQVTYTTSPEQVDAKKEALTYLVVKNAVISFKRYLYNVSSDEKKKLIIGLLNDVMAIDPQQGYAGILAYLENNLWTVLRLLPSKRHRVYRFLEKETYILQDIREYCKTKVNETVTI